MTQSARVARIEIERRAGIVIDDIERAVICVDVVMIDGKHGAERRIFV